MTRKQSGLIIGVATAVLAVVIAIVALFAPENNVQFAEAATMLAFVSAAAIGIERTIELGWTIVGSLGGSFWPLNAVSKQVNTLVDELDEALAPFYTEVTANLDTVAAAADKGTAWLDKARKEIADLELSFHELEQQPRDPQRLGLVTAAAAHNVSYIRKKYKDLLPDISWDEAEEVANGAINGLQNFVSSFKDNPGRRMISLYVGAIAGLAVAGIFGLDLFSAVMEPATDAEAESSPLTANPTLNVVLSGIIIGLGSSPTHEVIRLVQEYKERQKGTNSSTPNQPEASR